MPSWKPPTAADVTSTVPLTFIISGYNAHNHTAKMSTWDELFQTLQSSSATIAPKPTVPTSMTNGVVPSPSSAPTFVNIPIPAAFARYQISALNGSSTLNSSQGTSKDTDDLPDDTLAPFIRPRLSTWGSTISDSSCSGMSTVSSASNLHAGPSRRRGKAVQTPVDRTISSPAAVSSAPASKRRYTCPSSTFKRHCQKISDVESDISDNETESFPSRDTPMETDVNGVAAKDLAVCSKATRLGHLELKIVRQPENHHRARYQKEGSRGCIKDRTGNSCPAVQLTGYTGSGAIIQAFIGTESGPVRPHPLYRVCKVGGKHSTPCRERNLEGSIYALEMDLLRENGYLLSVDCLGIMKLRNADFEQIADAEELAKRRKRSPKVRLIFRCVVKMPDGTSESLQVASTPICCTPSPGVPEIHFISHTSAPVSGGVDIVIIGRNFVKDDSKIWILEKNDDEGVIWEREVPLLMENFNQVHLVGSVPPYKDLTITKPVENLSLVVRNKGGKQSEPHSFKYTPDESIMRHFSRSRSVPGPVPPPLTLSASSSLSSASLASLESKESAGNATPTSYHNHNGLMHSPPVHPPTSSASLATPPANNPNSSFQYCIQLPGSNQPIYITIPQTASGMQTSTTDTYHNVHAGRAGTTSVASAHANAHPGSNVVTVDLSQLPMPGNNDPMLSTGCAQSPQSFYTDQMNASPSMIGENGAAMTDEDLFNELLRDILGPSEDQDMNGFGDGNEQAALAAASLSALDINYEMRGNGQYRPTGNREGKPY
ncbi:nuclear factor of activated T-cells 5-like isoform X2 [Paramacrobiotus metropolitanus]|uniref:nuclear factor of activated T-cells 5-like isoform X2 n=1 Tax=Paramacrobiotus metropolitanus TaxID=2943436 RepID=UPI002445A147|nr:nuclear factor of activated T-cells 5-like isoform X2 [Paramacrobiotus metropolitanus]